MTKPKMIEVSSFYRLSYWDDKTLIEIIEFFSSVLQEIPEEFKQTVKCKFTDACEYDNAYLSVEIVYSRPETMEEKTKRVAADRRHKKVVEEEELKTLQRLKDKYEAVGKI